MNQRDGHFRGSRRTQPYALALGVVSALGVVVVGVTVLVGLVTGLRGGGESIELMSIDGADAMASGGVLAPSRRAPEAVLPEMLEEKIEEEVRTTLIAERRGEEVVGVVPTVSVPDSSVMTFDGRPLQPAKTYRMLVTAYSPDEQSCGIWADGITASGYSVWTNGMKLVAADTSLLPFGTIVTIPGYNGGRPVQVLDRGGRIKGHRLDVLYPTHNRALQWGAQRLDVTVWEYAD